MAFPDFPGVPPLLNEPIPAAVTLAAPLVNRALDAFAQKWGIFDEAGNEAIVPDSFIGLEYSNSANIPTHPQEEGSFESYNKVQNPKICTVMVAKGGTKKELADFITTLETLQASLDLYTIVTPNKSYTRANIDRCDYRRTTDNGAGMIVATLHATEIRAASAAFSQPGAINATASPAPAQAQISNGQVYPTSDAPTPSEVL